MNWNNAAVGVIGGPILSKGTGAIVRRVLSRAGTEVEEGVVRAVQRGSRNPKVAEAAAEGRARHAELAAKVKEKPGWKSEPKLTDPKTAKSVKPDVVKKGGRPLEYKPKTPTGRAQGARQLPKCERATGKKGRVIYYEPKQN